MRSGDTGVEQVVYTYLLKRGCSEERLYGIDLMVLSKRSLTKLAMEVFIVANHFRFESSRNDSTSS